MSDFAMSGNGSLSDIRSLQSEVTSLRGELRQSQRGAAALVHMLVQVLADTKALSPEILANGIELGIEQADASPEHPVLRMGADLLGMIRESETVDALA